MILYSAIEPTIPLTLVDKEILFTPAITLFMQGVKDIINPFPSYIDASY